MVGHRNVEGRSFGIDVSTLNYRGVTSLCLLLPNEVTILIISWVLVLSSWYFCRPQTELQKGYVFTPVCHSVHRGWVSAPVHAVIHTPFPQADTPPWAHPHLADTRPPDGYCSRRYASYWNAFLLGFISVAQEHL